MVKSPAITAQTSQLSSNLCKYYLRILLDVFR